MPVCQYVVRHADAMSIVGSYNSQLCSKIDGHPFSLPLAVWKAVSRHSVKCASAREDSVA